MLLAAAAAAVPAAAAHDTSRVRAQRPALSVRVPRPRPASRVRAQRPAPAPRVYSLFTCRLRFTKDQQLHVFALCALCSQLH